MECKQKENLKSCPCVYPGCPRHHLANKEAEKTLDRSIKNFIRDQKYVY